MKPLLLFLLVVGVSFPLVGLDTVSFQLKNAESRLLLVFWIIPAAAPGPDFPADGGLALATRQRLAPGETIRLTVNAEQAVAAVFLPWGENLGFRSLVSGGWLRFAELPGGKQLLLDAAGFAALNAGRAVKAALQDWGITIPQLVLDGENGDWRKVLPLAEFSPRFAPQNHPVSLQITVRDEAIWMAVRLRDDPAVNGTSFPFALSTQGFYAQVFPQGTDSRVWGYSESAAGRPVGSRVVKGTFVELWIPLERLTPDERQGVLHERLAFLLLGETAASADSFRMVTFSLDELP